MRATAKGWAVAVGVAMMAVGCGSPPNDDIAAARAALQKATAERAGQLCRGVDEGGGGCSSRARCRAESARGPVAQVVRTNRSVGTHGQGSRRQSRIRCGRGEGKGRGCGRQGEGRRRRAGQSGPGREARGSRRGQHPPPIKIKDVAPVYPAIARSARVTGAVTVEATIGEDGKVADARVVKSVPLLDQAALDAVRQWDVPTDATERGAGAGCRDGGDQLHAAVEMPGLRIADRPPTDRRAPAPSRPGA